MKERMACGMMIKQIHDELEKQANNTLRSQDLTIMQVRVLMELSAKAEKQMPLKELERLLHVAQSTIAGIVARLEQKGFVESFGDVKDRRIKIIGITPLGQRCCQLNKQNMDDNEEQLLSPLTEAERMIFYELLQKVLQGLL